MEQARTLWTEMLDATTYPDDEPMEPVLLAQPHSKPQWSRVEWTEQLLVHASTRSATQHSAPALTALAFINWLEGRVSKAHQFLQLALEVDPNYCLARLSDQMIATGMVAGWSMDKGTAYRDRGLKPEGLALQTSRFPRTASHVNMTARTDDPGAPRQLKTANCHSIHEHDHRRGDRLAQGQQARGPVFSMQAY